jgi:hypothetical protein
MRDDVDVSMFVGSQSASRIKPEEIDMADLPPIGKPQQSIKQANPVPPPLSPSQEEKPLQEETERNSERTEFRTEIRSDTSSGALFPHKRRTTRYSFEFYEDQILKLKDLKHHAEMNGEKVTLSDFAREAIDKYLKDKGF